MVTTRPPKTIVKPTALGPVANTDTKLLIYGLFQKGRVLAQDGDDSSIPQAAWEGKKALSGRTFVHFQDSEERWFARRVYFQVKRRANSLVALWSHQPLEVKS